MHPSGCNRACVGQPFYSEGSLLAQVLCQGSCFLWILLFIYFSSVCVCVCVCKRACVVFPEVCASASPRRGSLPLQFAFTGRVLVNVPERCVCPGSHAGAVHFQCRSHSSLKQRGTQGACVCMRVWCLSDFVPAGSGRVQVFTSAGVSNWPDPRPRPRSPIHAPTSSLPRPPWEVSGVRVSRGGWRGTRKEALIQGLTGGRGCRRMEGKGLQRQRGTCG